MNKTALATLTAACALSALAVPSISNVRFSQDATTRQVTVLYDLSCDQGECAIVTLDVWKDGTSIGSSNIWSVSGDVNRKLCAGTNLRIQWNPTDDWRPDADMTGVSIVPTAWTTNAPPPVMAVSFSTPSNVFYYAGLDALPGGEGVSNRVWKCDWMVMRKVPAANVTWVMGKNSVFNTSAGNSRANSHKVTLTQDYYIGVYPVTRGHVANFVKRDDEGDLPYRPMSGMTPTYLRGSSSDGVDWPTQPADDPHRVSQGSFLGIVRAFTGVQFDLPTDAQWEYACRAGVGTMWNSGSNTSDGADEVCWYKVNSLYDATNTSSGDTHEVGLKKANNWGCYDFHGNMWEAVLDWRQDALTDAVDPVGPTSGQNQERIWRGGYWGQSYEYCHSGHRNCWPVTQGWGARLACPAVVSW